ncbi:TPA: hypothetical protein NHR53_006057 [Pseudomonas aeruginosa]|nr:hypothetical protein [Pseudomonas aeruginosa]HCE8129465.1 hypothetical protein [Pseudomonas aeruginosa]HCF0447673.1 hypothetical protein [Pseudomonas aeruginosa]
MQQNDPIQAGFDDLLLQIHDSIMADHEVRWMQTVGGFGSLQKPTQGMFVKTGPHGGSMRGSIGWVAQVRLKQGQFGSDNYILCHPGNGGWLMQHSNNVFYPLTPVEVELVRPFFADRLPEDEDFTQGYTLGSEDTRAVGFLVDPPEGFEPRGGEGARMRTTVTGENGETTVTDTVFL